MKEGKNAADLPNDLLCAVHAERLAQLHTLLSAAAFLSALVLGISLHYHKIVRNQYYGYPDEWFPSVSATIGDWYPERNVFHLLIALTSGPRFLLMLLTFLAHRLQRPTSSLPSTLAVAAVLRTLLCGGWVYVTSSDHADAHDACMVLYIVSNLPYMTLQVLLTPNTPAARRAKSARRLLGTSFFATLVPLVYFYLRHKSHRIAGAYSIYGLFEWTLIVLDIGFDSVSILDFAAPTAAGSEGVADPGTGVELAVRAASAETTASESNGVYLSPADPTAEAQEPGAVVKALRRLDMASRGVRGWAAEVYLAFLFWTNLTAIGPMIFYSSVWAMGLSGDEVALFCIISPVILSLPIPFLSSFLLNSPTFGDLGLLVGVASRYLEGEGAERLRAAAFGVGLAAIARVASWWEVRKDPARLEGRALVFLLGLVFSVLIKFANYSLNPLWPFMRSSPNLKEENGGWNGVGLAVAPTNGAGHHWLAGIASTIGFGSLFFLLHYLCTDSGTTIAWSWNGYPSTGPFAFPHGASTIAALSAGILVASTPRYVAIARSPVAFAAASAFAAALYAFDSWPSFLGGCLLGICAVSLFPSFLSSILAASTSSPGIPFALAFFYYAVLELASTWTVAYAFVPAGWLLRERTDVVLGWTMAGVGIGLLPLRRLAASQASSPTPTRSRRTSYLHITLLFISLASVFSIIHHRSFFQPGVPYHAEERLFTAGIWTVHFGLDGYMWESSRRMAQFFKEAEVDVIAMLETDDHRVVGGNRDITQYIAHSLNMPYVDIGPGPQKNTWGAALISKFPILRSSHHLLPSPNGELAPAIYATLDVYGTEVDVVVAHNGQEEDPLDRELQSKELGRLMRESWPKPTVFLGYLVTTPHAERPAPYKLVVDDGKMLDISPKDLDRWCQYILYRGLHRIGYARLSRGSNPSVTDSEAQLGKFVVPLPRANKSSYTRSAEAAKAAFAMQQEGRNATSTEDEDEEQKEEKALRIPPIPLEDYVSHLHASPAPLDTDSTVWTPERYMPPSLRFPAQFYEGNAGGHRYIVLTGEKGGEGPNYMMDPEEKEWRRLWEIDELERLASTGECGVQ
ncbi:Frag1/DRAM/Sfk1 family-domain containing protein [Rhodotorula toruloides]|uniref:Frag1/DRAM/Sfk1 family-domain containing protein n=1 Tax=Rhodotorula toruloides TaxID=5286 RepID=A0A2T0ACU6_RHOTO|nr:Frag1/DRAM/Sfk1 family-domain containing protein [Rhodotorula toruloides]